MVSYERLTLTAMAAWPKQSSCFSPSPSDSEGSAAALAASADPASTMESRLLLGVWAAVFVAARTGLPGILILTMCCLALRLTPLRDQ